MKKLEDSHALAMISSHFSALKEYAFLSKHVVNSSMIFDEEKLLPTYRFTMGAPGKSYALDVATRYGIEENIVNGAKEFLSSQEHSESSELLNVLQKKLEEANKLLDQAKLEKRQAEEQLKKVAAEQELLKDRRQGLLESVNKEKEQIIAHAKEEIDDIISKLSRGDMKLHEVIELKHKLEELEDVPEDIIYDEEIKQGDYVSVPSLNVEGRVDRLKGSKAHINSDSGLSFDVDVSKLHKIAAPIQKKVKQTNNYELSINTSVGMELNLIGMHVDEARNALIKYIDACILKRLGQVRIIHGFGSGALRKMVREYLDKEHIKYRPGDASEGAGGATVVIFHD